MSKVSTVYDSLITKLVEIFPSKTRMHNPYEFRDNAELMIKDAFGVRVGPATRAEMEFNKLTLSRSFTVVFARSFATTGSAADAFDAVSKLILEDQQTFLNNIYSPNELGAQTAIDQIEINDISGVDFVATNEKKFISSEVQFTITISESVI